MSSQDRVFALGLFLGALATATAARVAWVYSEPPALTYPEEVAAHRDLAQRGLDCSWCCRESGYGYYAGVQQTPPIDEPQCHCVDHSGDQTIDGEADHSADLVVHPLDCQEAKR